MYDSEVRYTRTPSTKVLTHCCRCTRYSVFRESHIELLFSCHFATPADCAGELFKPSKDVASRLVCIEKNWKVLDFKFFVGDIISGVIFRPFWPRLPGPGRQLLEGIF